MSSTARIADWRHVDPSTFRDRIVPKNQPAVLRGVVLAHLPPTMHGLMGARSPEQLREIKALLAHALSRSTRSAELGGIPRT